MKRHTIKLLPALLLTAILFALPGCTDDREESVLAVPAGVRLTAHTTSSLTYGWDAVPGAKRYMYRLLDASGNTVTANYASENSVTISSLKKDATYNFTVMAKAGSAEFDSDWSDPVTGSTSESPADPLPVPSNVSADASAATANSLRFTWDAVDGAAGYEYICIDASDAEVASGTTTETAATVDGLRSQTTYRFAVRALAANGVDNSEYSGYAEGTTPEGGVVDLSALALPEWENDGLVRAFPGAEGGGMFVTGGRGGRVYHVTRLADDTAAGSLRHAVNQTGARTIVFDVDGIIELKSNLEIKNGNLTIAGQTAPGDGVCLKNYSLVVKADNVIVRYIRCRMGDEKGNVDDAMWGRWQQNVIIDHCSMSWSMDECSSFYANRNFTMQWCLIAESIRNGNHSKGTHGYGAIWGGVNASYHHNLLAHHDSRNPRFDGGDVYKPADAATPFHTDDRAVDYRNCVVYNFSNFPAYGGEGQKINFVGNCYKWGPASSGGPGQSVDSNGNWSNQNAKKRQWFYYIGATKESVRYGFPSVYIGGNTNRLESDGSAANTGVNADNWEGMPNSEPSLGDYTKLTAQVPIKPDGVAAKVTTHSVSDAFDKVVAYSGASHRRDAVDSRIATETANGTATCMAGSNRSINGYIDSQNDVGGWPAYAAGTAQADTDGDGIPDKWEEQFGLDRTNAADGNHKTLDGTGRYTNLEMYLWWLVREATLAQYADGTYTTLN